MKIAIAFPLMVLATFVCTNSQAAPNERDKEKRIANDRIESQAVVVELQSKFGRPAWYESASEAELESAPEDARLLLSHLSALSLDLGEGPIANEQSVVDGIRETVGTERACRSDKTCMAERAAKNSQAEFLSKVLFPLCEADTVLESADVGAKLNGGEIQDAQNKMKRLMPDYIKVRHHPFKGWSTDCQ